MKNSFFSGKLLKILGRWLSRQRHLTVNQAVSDLRGCKSLPAHSYRPDSSVVERFLGKKEAGSSILPPGSYQIILKIMAKKKKSYIKLQCKECGRINYFTTKPKTITEEKLELKKFCNWCKKHTVHKEKKK